MYIHVHVQHMYIYTYVTVCVELTYFICLTIVLFPDSPAPEGGEGGRREGGRRGRREGWEGEKEGGWERGGISSGHIHKLFYNPSFPSPLP